MLSGIPFSGSPCSARLLTFFYVVCDVLLRQAYLGGSKVRWDVFSLDPCQVKVSNHTAQQEFSLQVPRMCTPSYFCHRLNKDDWEDDREWATLIVSFNVISFVSAVFERFLALRLFLRAGETEVTERTVASARALFVQLWVPALYCK